MSATYNGNPLLKGANVPIDWTEDQVREWLKCKDDPIYFIEKYVKIITIDRGLQPMKLYEFQKEIILGITYNKKLISACARQMGKCHGKNTIYTVRNKTTGEILYLTARDFHELQKKKSNSKGKNLFEL